MATDNSKFCQSFLRRFPRVQVKLVGLLVVQSIELTIARNGN